MKKSIGTKRYDTEKASEVAQWKSPGNWGDLDHEEETLYRKRSGEFFLYGEGGPRTKYAKSEGSNHWTSGCKIIPLSWEAAREWAEEHLDANKYAEIFVIEEDENEGKIPVTLSIPKSTVDRARAEASKAGMSLSDYVASRL